MKAIVFDRYGGPEVFRYAEVEKPVAGPGEVLVRNHVTVATPPDVAFRSAKPFIVRMFTGWFRPKTPIMGGSFAGVVEAVGPGVTRFAPGERVFGAPATEFGTYAEFVSALADGSVARTPDGTSDEDACALSEGFLTAMPFIRDEARLQPGQSILINGASGSVGTVAVQIARHIGAHVTAVCSTRNGELVRSLGADEVIDYTREDFTQRTGAWDVVFDAVGKSSFTRARGALKPGGVYMTTVPGFGIVWHMLTQARPEGKRALLATTGLRPVADKRADLELMAEMAAAGVLRAVIDRRYPLSEMADAHRYVETGRKRGSVIVTMPHAERAMVEADRASRLLEGASR